MARFGSLIGVGLAATMMIAAPSFAATTPAKPATTAVKPLQACLFLLPGRLQL